MVRLAMQYRQVAALYEEICSNSSRLAKTSLVAGFLAAVPDEELCQCTLLLQGKVFPDWDERELGLSTQLVSRAIALATGYSAKDVESAWRNVQDLGETAQYLTGRKTQSTLWQEPLSVKKVFENLQKVASEEGSSSVDRKIKLLSELLTSASPLEAKYVIRTVLQQLRIGLGEGVMRDGLAWSFAGSSLVDGKLDKDAGEWVAAVQDAYDLTNDFGAVAIEGRKSGIEGLRKMELCPGRPVKVMLFIKAKGFDEAFETVGKPCACEYKYDGFRAQIHKSRSEIRVFTRRLENVTRQFPDVVEAVKSVHAESFVLDAEIVGMKDGKYSAFQDISQRIKRKHDIHRLVKELPVQVCVFDLLFCDGRTFTHCPFSERRKELERIVPFAEEICPSKIVVVEDDSSAQSLYEESLAAGNEGMMMKRLDAPYKPGARVGYGMKIKPTMETLEVVIVGAEWGEGKRAEWMSSFILAVRDGESLVEIGRMGTGLKEKPEEGFSFGEMTSLLMPLVEKEDGRVVSVAPKVVVEVDYEEIQASPSYSSGFALRFPRFVRLREDRAVEDVASLDDVKALYSSQRGRSA